MMRDTRGVSLDDAQRLSHFPASPLMSLSWFHGAEVGFMQPDGAWSPFGADVVVFGSQLTPRVTWAPRTGFGGMLCFTPDVAQALFGLDPAALVDGLAPAAAVLDRSWQPWLRALPQATTPAAAMALITAALGPRWQVLQGRAGQAPSLRQVGRAWVGRLALQALQWRQGRSPRQVERRLKEWTGRSLRDWQALVRTEGLFFAARDRQAQGLPFDWAGLAQDEGFADQAHLVRSARRITGFAPGEFARRFVEDESFWIVRLWV
ncbi:AraC family transcriptional regulator [Ideonella sp. TBM-1]|uniref:AraC family transcriptional regulator n=1 Tax=Ideonella livida TaxID=2707176 RepID=A0A7C9PK92_9BURK|nr:AraC family transcriptional regulator [Ideonella livida]